MSRTVWLGLFQFTTFVLAACSVWNSILGPELGELAVPGIEIQTRHQDNRGKLEQSQTNQYIW